MSKVPKSLMTMLLGNFLRNFSGSPLPFFRVENGNVWCTKCSMCIQTSSFTGNLKQNNVNIELFR